jgi:hypothetical protein
MVGMATLRTVVSRLIGRRVTQSTDGTSQRRAPITDRGTVSGPPLSEPLGPLLETGRHLKCPPPPRAARVFGPDWPKGLGVIPTESIAPELVDP